MSYGIGPPAAAAVAPPPPPKTKRRSSWSSWWKPVKGTSTAGRYSYYESDDDGGSSRPGSKSSSKRSSSRSSWRRRFSLSFGGGDDKDADAAARKDIAEQIQQAQVQVKSNAVPSTARKPEPKMATGKDGEDGGDQAANGKRKSTSRPPPAFFNRPHHQRMVSDSALHQPRPPANHHDRAQLKVQPLQPQRGTLQKPSVHRPSTAARTSLPPFAPPGFFLPAQPIQPPPVQLAPVVPPASRIKPPATQTAPVANTQKLRTSSALQAPAIDPMIAVEGMPGWVGRPSMENRTRRGSSSTTASYNSALSSQDSYENRMRSSSWGSQTSFESLGMPPPPKSLSATRLSYANYQIQSSGQHAPWRQPQRPQPIRAYRKKAQPGEIFAALPGEVLELILEELKKLHLQPASTSCATCWMRDCCAVALSARKWLKFARVALYEDIQLIGAEGTVLKKRYKITHNARLVLLRRTLRNMPTIAAMVRSLKVPNMLVPGITLDEYHSLVASVVMACPNLERLTGFFPRYDHNFSRIFQALSSRERLKEMNWIVNPSPHQRQQKIRPSTDGNIQNKQMAPGDLQPLQSRAFYEQHVNWSHVTHLTVHCRPGATLTPDRLLTDCLSWLPALQTLHLSHIPYTSFNDMNLMSLPRLKQLTLSHLLGVTTAGLSTFATRKAATTITSLTLIHIDVDSLPALARIFANLTNLQTFNLVQSYPPLMPTDEFVMLFPYLASSSLKKLHWDIPYHSTPPSAADTILSRSIFAGGFPQLRSLRTPNDPEGIFQSLCRPRERVDSPADRYRYPNSHHARSSTVNLVQNHSRIGSRSSSYDRRPGTNKSPPESPGFAPSGDGVPALSKNSDLHSARLAAQSRLEHAKRVPRFAINIIGPDGTVLERHGVGAFIGSVSSKISYHLLPDAGATDEGGGLVGVKELLMDNGEEIGAMGAGAATKKERGRDRSRSRDREADVAPKIRDGCTGKWNMRDVVGVDKKERERLSHTERGRWRGVTLA